MAETTSTRAPGAEAVQRVAETATQYAERFGERAEEWLEMKDNWVEGARGCASTRSPRSEWRRLQATSLAG